MYSLFMITGKIVNLAVDAIGIGEKDTIEVLTPEPYKITPNLILKKGIVIGVKGRITSQGLIVEEIIGNGECNN